MKAIVQVRYGSPATALELRDIDEPAITDGEVLVEVHAAAIAGDELRRVRGEPYADRLTRGLRRPRPRVLGGEVAGRVLAVGAGVPAVGVGDHVYGWCDGAFTERVAVAATHLARTPAGATCAQAASLPIAASTALQAVRDTGRVRPGDHVLVIGAAGGVGSFAVQIAKASGAVVTAVCSTANTDLARSIGADEVIDYTTDDVAGRGRRYDVVIDLTGDRPLTSLLRVVSPRGSLVLVGRAGGAWFGGTGRSLGARLVSPLAPQQMGAVVRCDRHADLVALGDLVDRGQLTPVVSAHYALAEAAAAIDHFAPGHGRGRVVLTL